MPSGNVISTETGCESPCIKFCAVQLLYIVLQQGPLKKPLSQLPMVGVDEQGNVSNHTLGQNEVHVYATTNPRVHVDKEEPLVTRVKLQKDSKAVQKVDKSYMVSFGFISALLENCSSLVFVMVVDFCEWLGHCAIVVIMHLN